MSGPSIERARLHVPCGSLAVALIPRFIRSLAAHSMLGVDRAGEAVLVSEAVSARCAELLPDDRLHVSVKVIDDGLEVLLGPLAAGVPARILAADHLSGTGTIRALCTAVDVRPGRDGRERLRLTLT